MAIYRYTESQIQPVDQATFSALGIAERQDLQRLLRDQIEIIAPDSLVIAEEFGSWEDSRRRIDLLAVDKHANLVVIELKCTEDGGHMELQALRYAAMVSTLTFDRAVEVFEAYLRVRTDDRDAERTILDFLEWDEPDENEFAADVRVVLASAEFSRELTTTVLWLCERGIDIRCVRLRPYGTTAETLLDIQQIIPLPEAEDYQVRLRQKSQKEREVRRSSRDLTKFNLRIGDETFVSLPKRRLMHSVIKALCDRNVAPDEIVKLIDWRSNVFRSVDGVVDEHGFLHAMNQGKRRFDPKRWFIADDELIHHQNRTYALSNGWGIRTEAAVKKMIEKFQPTDISFERAD